jgi:hypothetical protein
LTYRFSFSLLANDIQEKSRCQFGFFWRSVLDDSGTATEGRVFHYFFVNPCWLAKSESIYQVLDLCGNPEKGKPAAIRQKKIEKNICRKNRLRLLDKPPHILKMTPRSRSVFELLMVTNDLI